MKGHVIIKNSKNETIVNADNMVVDGGKELLRTLLLDAFFVGTSSANRQLYIYAFEDAGAVKATDKLAKKSDTTDTTTFSFTNRYFRQIIDRPAEADDYGIKIELTIDSSFIASSEGAALESFNSIGLGMKETNGDETLLTRIMFDTVYISPENQSFIVDYYLYF